jgi:hypothetical protein
MSDFKYKTTRIFSPEENEHFVEPHWVNKRFFETELTDEYLRVHDPMAGWGRIPEAALAAGHYATGSDLVEDRATPHEFSKFWQNHMNRWSAVDFFEETRKFDAIVCNPAFTLHKRFAIHALTLAPYVAMIMPVRKLNAAHWMKELPLVRIWLLTPRPSMPSGPYIASGGKVGGGTVDFCWVVIHTGHVGKPQLGWMHRDV